MVLRHAYGFDDEFGADAFRIYEMFLGPLDKAKPWNKKGLYGAYRFIERLWKLFLSFVTAKP